MIGNLRQLADWTTHGPIERKNSIASDLLGVIRRWRRRRQAVNSLRNLPDYLLKDIGVTRVEIGFELTRR